MNTSTRRRGFRVLPLLLSLLLAGLFVSQPASAAVGPRSTSPETAVADDGAHVVAQQQIANREIDLTIASPALGTTAMVRLVTPVDWTPDHGARHWPTLWLLHGCCDNYTSWTRWIDLTAVSQLDHVLVVMPEAGTAGFYSNWLGNDASGHTPAWETFHLDEVMQIVDRGYGAGPDRAVAGLSVGGFGALSYAARHPGMFRAAASYSGVVDTRYPQGGIANVEQIVSGQGENPDALWGDPRTDSAIWAAHNPTDLAARLRNLPVFLSCGNGQPGPYDPPGTTVSAFEALFLSENLALTSRLTALHARDLVTDFYGAGTHSAAYWTRELLRSLPMLLGAMRVAYHA